MGFWGTLGGVVSSIIDAKSQQHANTANAQNIQQQEQFQADQSSTQHQREAKDLAAAGFNPALTAQSGGNTAATGGTFESRPTMQNTGSKLAQAIDSYTTLANGSAQRELIRAQTENQNAQTGYAEAQTEVVGPQRALGTDPTYLAKTREVGRSDLERRIQENQNYPSQFTAQLSSLNQGIATAKAQEAATRSQITLNEQQFTNEWFRKNIAPYINSTAATIKPFIPVIKY
jgi:hypothetical protein